MCGSGQIGRAPAIQVRSIQSLSGQSQVASRQSGPLDATQPPSPAAQHETVNPTARDGVHSEWPKPAFALGGGLGNAALACADESEEPRLRLEGSERQLQQLGAQVCSEGRALADREDSRLWTGEGEHRRHVAGREDACASQRSARGGGGAVLVVTEAEL